MSLEELANELETMPDLAPVPDGLYRVVITRFEKGKQNPEKGDRDYWRPMLDVEGEPSAKEVSLFLGFVPQGNETGPGVDRDKLRLKNFLRAFSLPFRIITTLPEGEYGTYDEAVGASAEVTLGVHKGSNGEDENYVRQWFPKK
jgi:hypothetical protein